MAFCRHLSQLPNFTFEEMEGRRCSGLAWWRQGKNGGTWPPGKDALSSPYDWCWGHFLFTTRLWLWDPLSAMNLDLRHKYMKRDTCLSSTSLLSVDP